MGYAAGPRKKKPAAGLDPRMCTTCGVEFRPYRSTQIYCSEKCSDNGRRATATRQAYLARPEVKERMQDRRRVSTSPNPEQVRLYNLRGNLARYGVTIEWYEEQLAAQDGACAICGHIPNGVKAAARLHVDHDHVTDVNRGLLCHRCNPGVGYFRDDPDLLRAAAEYIERHRG